MRISLAGRGCQSTSLTIALAAAHPTGIDRTWADTPHRVHAHAADRELGHAELGVLAGAVAMALSIKPVDDVAVCAVHASVCE